ncbi:hypothetical protein QFZ37_000439 [Chryseobacterium ginsenosidimutans]|uniref:hypothetical protein n=1 Tax=Chryseobacterium ginsenosidimutans TaxID=687846 RepID=UPI00277F99B0|nr:hypothetical protein [Chryseobacterium ginsenosidimutans]MDQ0592070.1 hypothetical protein [Chryseobacterium ginsenosidimutans]
MEKFHKYCLSVLLVIICSNISAQTENGSIKSEDCKKLYEIYNRILGHECEVSQEFCLKEDSIRNFAINHRQNAIDLIEKFFSGKQQDNCYKNTSGVDFSEKEKHIQLLKNFEKSSRDNLFAATLYFKTKVSKIRNKDYLNVIG